MKDGLNPKQLRFCQEYVVDLNGTQAAIRAGYSERTANEQAAQLLAKLSIKEKVAELQQGISNKTGITIEYIINSFRSINERCQQAEPVLDKDGNPTGEYRFDSSGANKATEMLGKMIGAFETDNKQKQTVINAPIINRPARD